MSLIQEKANQAIEILKEQNVDLWLTFVRETSGVRDPALDLLIGPNDLTWLSALILTRKGEKIAIVGNFEKNAIQRLAVFDEVLGYDTSIRELLRDTIARLNPDKIAVNISGNNVHADGLTHSMYERLRDYLDGTPYADRLTSAEAVISAMRGRKTPTEQARIYKAVEITDKIFKKTFDFIKVGMTEIESPGICKTSRVSTASASPGLKRIVLRSTLGLIHRLVTVVQPRLNFSPATFFTLTLESNSKSFVRTFNE